jgi:hypothetical protein
VAWSSGLTRLPNTVKGVRFHVGEIVLVRPDENYTPTASGNKNLVPLGASLKYHWVAKVLGVRGKDERNVFVLIQWLYRPEDLEAPLGREPHHGSFELIASNYLQVIDARKFLLLIEASKPNAHMFSPRRIGRWTRQIKTLG